MGSPKRRVIGLISGSIRITRSLVFAAIMDLCSIDCSREGAASTAFSSPSDPTHEGRAISTCHTDTMSMDQDDDTGIAL